MNNSARYFVSVDMGTSGFHAAAVRVDGTIAFEYDEPFVPVRPAPGLSEYPADKLLQTVQRVLHTVLDQVDAKQVISLAFASQRSTIVLWDKITGEAVGPVLTWEDGRAQAQTQQADISQEKVHLLTGLYKVPFFSAPKIAWTLQHIPAAAAALKRGHLLAAPLASYIIWHLTNHRTFATDHSLAQRTLFFDISTLTWKKELCHAFGVPESILPPIYPSISDYGKYTYKEISIPITVCVGDQQAAVSYFGLSKQDSLINYGTGAFWLYHAGEKPVFLPGLLTSVSATGADQAAAYLLEGPVNSAGSALLWLKAQGISFDENDLQSLCAQAKHPVWFLPALGGLGAPYWDYRVSATTEGLTPQTQKSDWVAGVVRSIAFRLADVANYLEQNKYPLGGSIQVSGGLSQMAYLTSFQADILQHALHVTAQAQATLLGAAWLASCAYGKPFMRENQSPRVTPTLDANSARKLYARWQEFVARARFKK